MEAIVIRVRVESTTLVLPELEPLIGRTVEIKVRHEDMAPFSSSPNASTEYLEEALVESGAISRLA